MNNKIHVIELSHFIKLFFYSIQNRDRKCSIVVELLLIIVEFDVSY